jgi:hypothetical protein
LHIKKRGVIFNFQRMTRILVHLYYAWCRLNDIQFTSSLVVGENIRWSSIRSKAITVLKNYEWIWFMQVPMVIQCKMMLKLWFWICDYLVTFSLYMKPFCRTGNDTCQRLKVMFAVFVFNWHQLPICIIIPTNCLHYFSVLQM